MTSNELLEIHFNNSDLNLFDLSKIHRSSIPAVRSILDMYYKDKDWNPIHLLEPKPSLSDIFEDVIEQAPQGWDNDLMSLPDALKDLTVYSWFKAHPTWIDDYLPEAVFSQSKSLIHCLYTDTPAFRPLLNECRKSYSVTTGFPIEGNEDVFYSSSALGDFETICTDAAALLGSDHISFADMLKELIYLNLENTLREKLFDAQGLEESYDYN